MPPEFGDLIVPTLALDTSGSSASVALLLSEHGGIRVQSLAIQDFSRLGHSQQILRMVDEVLEQAGLKSRELARLAVVNGPGAFTGLRVAVGVAQGLGLGANLPCFSIDSLSARAMAWIAERETVGQEKDLQTLVLVANDARLSEVYCASGLLGHKFGTLDRMAPKLCSPEKALEGFTAEIDELLGRGPNSNLVCLGTAFQAIPLLDQWRQNQSVPTLTEQKEPNIALGAAYLASRRGAAGPCSAGQLQPLYLRDNVALTTAEQGKLRQANLLAAQVGARPV